MNTGLKNDQASPELQRQRPLLGVEGEEPRPVAAQHRAGRHHLAIEQRGLGEAAVEEAAVAVSPVHHRRDAEPMAKMQDALRHDINTL